jgi:hypothetical protein
MNKSAVRSVWLVFLLAVMLPLPVMGVLQVPHPREVLGFDPGDDYKMADYSQMLEYYEALDRSSDRVQKIEIGQSTHGKPMLLLFISSEENLRQLDRWKEISARLARAEGLDDEDARTLAREGKAVVWIDGGMHATERAHAQMTPLLAYKVATEETPEMQNIRDNVIFLLMPVINPDGLDIVAHWYWRNLGTPFENTGPPELYQEYVGHDNNRDWYMILQKETQNIARVVYNEWYPQIVYNQHQTSPDWTRIFVPPFADPVNPHIPAGVITGVNLVGTAMVNRFSQEEKDGVISRLTFSMWWNGGMRTAPYFHNQIGILTETGHPTPTPRYYDPADRPETVGGRRGGGVPTDRPTLYYPDPFEGGWLRFRDAIDYMITGSMAVLDIGAKRSEEWLYNIYRMGRESIEAGQAGGPYAYVMPATQWDPGETVELVNVLRRGGVDVHQATSAFTAGGRQFEAGSYVVYAAQAFRPYVMDLMERQEYPDRFEYRGGPPVPPYDLAGWTLPMQMGIDVIRVDEPFTASATEVELASNPAGDVSGSSSFGYVLSHRENQSALAVNRLLAAGDRVHWAGSDFRVGGTDYGAGTIVIESGSGTADRVAGLAQELGLDFAGLSARPSTELHSLHTPRVAMYKSWDPNMDEGWTRWLLEQYEFPLDTLHDTDIQGGDLSGYDAIILPSQSPDDMMHGHSPGTMPDEYVGGLGVEGAAALKRYVDGGGTVIALDEASGFAINQFNLPVRDVIGGLSESDFFIPGSLIALETDPNHAVGYGMQEKTAASFVRSRAFRAVSPASAGDNRAAPPPVEVVSRYAEDDLLMSGWAWGEERYLAGRPAVVRVEAGEGDVLLIGFRAQMRGQPRGTFKLLFNAIHGSTLPELPSRERPVMDGGGR